MTDRHVRTGIFLAPFHPNNENPTLTLERDMDLLVHLDKLNYHEAWIGEHFTSEWENIPSPELFIAKAIGLTKQIRLGTGVSCMPNHMSAIRLSLSSASLRHTSQPETAIIA